MPCFDGLRYSHLLRSFQEDQLDHGDPLDPAEDKQDNTRLAMCVCMFMCVYVHRRKRKSIKRDR